ncbi:MAG TPA: Sua5/YciO/YrdC/YwlC family protein, partial [Syntrophales bacterium]|nr:Sua5/YciO/YrdC/YwlC family protein [Syntrophales bacterium]
ALVRELGQPIISTSVTTEDGEVLSDPIDIKEKYGHSVDLIIDGGILVSKPSTIISLVDDTIEVIREGKGDVSTLV